MLAALHGYAHKIGENVERARQVQAGLLPVHQQLCVAGHRRKMEVVARAAAVNQTTLSAIARAFGAGTTTSPLPTAAGRAPSPYHVERVVQLLQQLCCEWSAVGAPERAAAFDPLLTRLEVAAGAARPQPQSTPVLLAVSERDV